MFRLILASLLAALLPSSAALAASALPQAMSFCGEAVDLRQADIFRAIDQNLVLLSEAKSRVWLSLKRSSRYLPALEKSLKEAGLPEDLKYIPLTITGLDPLYNAGGRGLWRLKEAEAKQMGLRVDKEIDERLDPVASTEASLKRLAEFKARYGSWTAAMAAHLIGQQALEQAIEEAGGEKNFYKLYLPDGLDILPCTVLAGKLLFGQPALYGYSLAPGRAWPPFSGRRQKVKQDISARLLASELGVDYKTLRDANPQLLSAEIPAGVEINLP